MLLVSRSFVEHYTLFYKKNQLKIVTNGVTIKSCTRSSLLVPSKSEQGVVAANHTASTTGSFGALAENAARPGQDVVKTVVDESGKGVAAAGAPSISSDLGHGLLQTAGFENRSREGSRESYGQCPDIKEHIKVIGSRGKRKRFGKRNKPG